MEELRMWPELDPTTAIVGIGDFNGDGITDLLLKSADGTYTDWLGQTDGSFTDNSTNFDLNPGTDWHVVATGNFNGDGFDDVLWRSDSGTADDLLGATNGSFVGNPNFVLNPGADWHIVGTGDFNGDGLSDILWQSDSGTLNEFLGQSNGGFIGNILATNPGSAWHVAGTGDFNGDGKDDILWRNDSGVISDWLGQADGTFVDNYANAANGAAGTSWQVAGTGDFNGDGKDDILWRNTDGTIDDFLGQANGGFVDNYAVGMQPLSNDLQIAGVGHFDGDGRADVLIRESDGNVQTWVGAANGAILSPMEKLWQDEVATVARFFDEINNALDASEPTTTHGSDQNSYYSDEEDRGSPINSGLADLWGWHPVIEANPNVSFLQLLDGTIDQDFQLLGLSQTGFSAAFDGNFGTMSIADALANSFSFDMTGFDLTGTSESGPPPLPDPSPQAPIYVRLSLSSGGYFVFDPMQNGINFADGYGGGGALPFDSEGNAWANAHISLINFSQADVHAFNVLHTDLAKFYDFAKTHPNAPIQIGNGLTVPASVALQNFNSVMVYVQNTGGGDNGGQFEPNTTGGGAIIFNPENSTLASEYTSYGDLIYNFGIFHELGHELDNANAQSLYNGVDTEGYANTAARSIANCVGVPLPAFANNTPPGGYK
jgi:hypothetical protein